MSVGLRINDMYHLHPFARMKHASFKALFGHSLSRVSLMQLPDGAEIGLSDVALPPLSDEVLPPLPDDDEDLPHLLPDDDADLPPLPDEDLQDLKSICENIAKQHKKRQPSNQFVRRLPKQRKHLTVTGSPMNITSLLAPTVDGWVQDDFLELFSPPRIVPRMQALGFRAQLSADICTGWDLSLPSMQAKLLDEIRHRKPNIVHTSCPCTPFSCLQESNKTRYKDPEAKKK